MTQVSDHIFLGPVATRRVWGATSTVPSPNAYGIGPAGRLVALDIAPAAVATLASAVTLAGAGTVPLGTGGTQNTTGLTPDQSASCIIFDCERCISIQSANNLSGVHVSATGIDRYGQTLTTGTTGPNNATIVLPKAMKGLVSVAFDGAAAAVTIATADVFGLPYCVTDNGYILGASFNGAPAQTVTLGFTGAQTGSSADCRGTITPGTAGASNGTRRLIVGMLAGEQWISPQIAKAVSIYGQPQA
jgi:hypothetical protein